MFSYGRGAPVQLLLLQLLSRVSHPVLLLLCLLARTPNFWVFDPRGRDSETGRLRLFWAKQLSEHLDKSVSAKPDVLSLAPN